MRTSPSVMPSFARSSALRPAWVMLAGCEISVSTPPSDSPSVQSFTAFSIAFAFSCEPVSNEIIDAKAGHLPLRQSMLRMRCSPG